jgi:hypothetical protein
MSNPSKPKTRRIQLNDTLTERVAKRVMELLREQARIDSERRSRPTRRKP